MSVWVYLCTMRLQILFLALTSSVWSQSDIHFIDDSNDAEQFAPIPVGSSAAEEMQSGRHYGNDYTKFVRDVIAHGVTNLGLAIDRSVAAYDDNSDFVVYSPVSIASALALVMLGSYGKTFEELSSLLSLNYQADNLTSVHNDFGQLIRNVQNSPPKDTQLIRFATGLFVQNNYPVRNQYKSASNAAYQCEISNLDFRGNPVAAKNAVNSWVKTKTLGKIQEIMPMNPSAATKVVIVSSLYFKSDWDNPFDSGLTKLSPFYPDGKKFPSTVKVHLMANGGEYPYYNDPLLKCEILGLPYKGKTVTFYIVIPHESNKEKLRELENRLTASEISRLINSTQKTQVLAAIPKMKLSSTLQLNGILQNLGLRSLFDPRESNLVLLSPGESSNSVGVNPSYHEEEEPFVFSQRFAEVDQVENNSSGRVRRQTGKKRVLGLADYENSLDYVRNLLKNNNDKSNPGLYADQVLHKVFVDVNEKGTEAAAATGISLTRSGTRDLVKADVPFFFFIYHEETKMMLFWGSVKIPSPHVNE